MFENAFNSIDRELHNEEGLASELDYAEQTSWMLFLKYLDDIKQDRQDEVELEGRDYAPTHPTAIRWKTWASAKNDCFEPKLTFTAQCTSDGFRVGADVRQLSKERHQTATVPVRRSGLASRMYKLEKIRNNAPSKYKNH